MYQMKTEEELRAEISKARLTGDLSSLRVSLPPWISEKVAKKRIISDDDKSDLVLEILERFSIMWNLSKSYHIQVVLGFFVTYGFNLYRNQTRKQFDIEGNIAYIDMWRDKKEVEINLFDPNVSLRELVEQHLTLLPLMSNLVISLRFDLPLLGKYRKAFLWRLHQMGQNRDSFQALYDKKKQAAEQKLDTCNQRIIRYTRLLMQAQDPEKRKEYGKHKREWMVLREKAINKSLFSEREIARILGITRKEVRVHLAKTKNHFQKHGQELLHCA